MEKQHQKTAYADPTSALTHYLDELLHSATTQSVDTVVPEEAASDSAERVDVGDIADSAEAKPVVEENIRADRVLAEQQRVALLQAEQQRRREESLAVERAARRERARQAAAAIKARREAEKQRVVVAEKPQPAPAVVAPPEATSEKIAEPAPVAMPETQGRPEWAENAFECLIFRVAGLQLAVPLVLLGAIHPMEAELHEIPGRPRWFMGMMPFGGRNLRVVDTAEWVMAGRVPDDAREGYRFVIRLDDSDWGLACDNVAQSFRLHPDDVKWRSERSRRPWLAGTVIDQMCALLDVRAMSHLLSRAETEHQLDLS
ncbi:MAG: chemotaxis protein CheW [Alteromonadaceae bacterium]|nr:chemotaxis protein CheW [Alteromonadaceae bacterium]MBH84190.1 chemotaxis protein CheW [Alteromonadaceae bacterium]|tara:strand:+ start:19444 stop:20391 length:948 start_codon:yes stop_codon:yes gene_type:complete